MENITVRKWIDKFNNGEFEAKNHKTQCSAVQDGTTGFVLPMFCLEDLRRWETSSKILKMILSLIILPYGLRTIALVQVLYTTISGLSQSMKMRSMMTRKGISYILAFNAVILMGVNICMKYLQQGVAIKSSLSVKIKEKY